MLDAHAFQFSLDLTAFLVDLSCPPRRQDFILLGRGRLFYRLRFFAQPARLTNFPVAGSRSRSTLPSSGAVSTWGVFSTDSGGVLLLRLESPLHQFVFGFTYALLDYAPSSCFSWSAIVFSSAPISLGACASPYRWDHALSRFVRLT